MTTILKEGKRACNSRCYNAKRPVCTCLCMGINHGAGFEKAIQNTKRERLWEFVPQKTKVLMIQSVLPL